MVQAKVFWSLRWGTPAGTCAANGDRERSARDARQNSPSGVGIFEVSTVQAFLFLALQSTKTARNEAKGILQTLPYEFPQSYRLIDLVLRLEMLVVYFPIV